MAEVCQYHNACTLHAGLLHPRRHCACGFLYPRHCIRLHSKWAALLAVVHLSEPEDVASSWVERKSGQLVKVHAFDLPGWWSLVACLSSLSILQVLQTPQPSSMIPLWLVSPFLLCEIEMPVLRGESVMTWLSLDDSDRSMWLSSALARSLPVRF